MTDVRALFQLTLDTALNGAVHVYWQRKAKIVSESNPDEFIVFSIGKDSNTKHADNAPFYKRTDVTGRYYYRNDLIDTAAGITTVQTRKSTIVNALTVAGFSVPDGVEDIGDVDDIGYYTALIACTFGQVV